MSTNINRFTKLKYTKEGAQKSSFSIRKPSNSFVNTKFKNILVFENYDFFDNLSSYNYVNPKIDIEKSRNDIYDSVKNYLNLIGKKLFYKKTSDPYIDISYLYEILDKALKNEYINVDITKDREDNGISYFILYFTIYFHHYIFDNMIFNIPINTILLFPENIKNLFVKVIKYIHNEQSINFIQNIEFSVMFQDDVPPERSDFNSEKSYKEFIKEFKRNYRDYFYKNSEYNKFCRRVIKSKTIKYEELISELELIKQYKELYKNTRAFIDVCSIDSLIKYTYQANETEFYFVDNEDFQPISFMDTIFINYRTEDYLSNEYKMYIESIANEAGQWGCNQYLILNKDIDKPFKKSKFPKLFYKAFVDFINTLEETKL